MCFFDTIQHVASWLASWLQEVEFFNIQNIMQVAIT